MCVREQNVADRQRVLLRNGKKLRDFIARIDQDSIACVLASEHESVLVERPDCANFHQHALLLRAMVLALVDDLMFRSKIKSTATQLGVSVAFAGSKDTALASMRASSPSLVIFDLDNARVDAMGTVAAMKADTALASIATAGYASHVHVDAINAARAAGVDNVLARSAFATQLPHLLSGR